MDSTKLAQEVLDYLDHGTEPFIEKVNWLAYTAAPTLAKTVLEMGNRIKDITSIDRTAFIIDFQNIEIATLRGKLQQQQTEIKKLRAEIQSVSVFLAVHGVEGYKIEFEDE